VQEAITQQHTCQYFRKLKPVNCLLTLPTNLTVSVRLSSTGNTSVTMPVFFNPFMKHDVSDFPDVYVPLDRFQRDPSVVAAHDEKLGMVSNAHEGEKGVEAATSPKIDYGANTLEGLRAEIDLGMRCTLAILRNLSRLIW